MNHPSPLWSAWDASNTSLDMESSDAPEATHEGGEYADFLKELV